MRIIDFQLTSDTWKQSFQEAFITKSAPKETREKYLYKVLGSRFLGGHKYIISYTC